MNTPHIGCPIDHDKPSRYTLVTMAAQRHIDEPGNHIRITTDLAQQLETHYELMVDTRPDHARQKIARGIRAAALAAFFHISATALAVDAPIREGASDADNAYRHTYLRTWPAHECAQRTAAASLHRQSETRSRMLESDNELSKYRDLAGCLPELNQAFMGATKKTAPHLVFGGNFSDLLEVAADDNATAQLGVLVSAGSACRQQYPEADASTMTQFVLSHLPLLGQRASVNRSASAAMSVYDDPTEPGFFIGRKQMIVEYETALTEDRAMTQTADTLHVQPALHWGGSLQSGPWRQPGYCTAYPELTCYRDANVRFRTIEVELAAAAHIAEQTIYANWPG